MSAGFFSGQVDEVRIWDTARSPAEILGDQSWPFDLAGPEESCPCGCPRFERLGDGGWRCEGCGEVVYQDCSAPCEGCEAVPVNQTAEDMERDAAMAFGYDEQEV